MAHSAQHCIVHGTRNRAVDASLELDPRKCSVNCGAASLCGEDKSMRVWASSLLLPLLGTHGQ